MPKVLNNAVNQAKCICAECPSYTECAIEKKEILFCALEIGKGDCSYPMNGCVCGSCAVHSECGLTSAYYCIHGSAEMVDKE